MASGSESEAFFVLTLYKKYFYDNFVFALSLPIKYMINFNSLTFGEVSEWLRFLCIYFKNLCFLSYLAI